MIGNEIIGILEQKFPLKNSESWDNTGIQIGDPNKKVKKICMALDVTEDVIDQGIKDGVDMIISHHPMIFDPIKKITALEPIGNKIIKAIKNDILIYAMHTNLDSSPNGLNEYVTELLGIKKSTIIDENTDQKGVGIGRYYKLKKPMSIEKYAQIVKKSTRSEHVRIFTKDRKKEIKNIALVNGSGMSYWKKAHDMGAELFITGDVRHHDSLDAIEVGMSIIDISHYDCEKMFSDILIKILNNYKLDIKIYNNGNISTII